jgi:multidrug efflux system outer membrane protein
MRLVGYIDVLTAQPTLLANERSAAQIGGQRMVATVVLVKALGGGWLDAPTPPQAKPNNQNGETEGASSR